MSLFSSLSVRAGTAWFAWACVTAACADDGVGQPSARLIADAGEHSSDTQEGSDASHHAAPDASKTDDSGASVSCGDLQQEFDSAAARASGEVDSACAQNSDCRVVEPLVACRSACTVVSVSTAGKAEFEARVAALEAKLCTPFAAAGCVADEFDCRAQEVEPRCSSGQCDLKGAGCPDVVDALEGKACGTPNKECRNPGWCATSMRCSDEAQPGDYRWVAVIPLC